MLLVSCISNLVLLRECMNHTRTMHARTACVYGVPTSYQTNSVTWLSLGYTLCEQNRGSGWVSFSMDMVEG